jgi:hypothetical protein
MLLAWHDDLNDSGGYRMRIAFRAFDRSRRCGAFSAIRKRA